VFYHGHGATLTRDVLNRQQVVDQISESGANAVLVAPQLAYDARSSNPGKLFESGAFARMVREAGDQLTRLYGDPRAAKAFANMPVIIVAYSGGYLSAATSIERGGLKGRVRGIVLLDALYGELGGFANWISRNRSGFFVSSWTRSTQGRNAELERMLSDRDVTFARALRTANLNGSVVFLPGEDGIRHRDFVNHAWANKPIKDILVRLPEYRL
jgi:pimeloyl-ACP methyl ester carboxylesterase